MSAEDAREQALAWQTGIWDRMSRVYFDEIDTRFTPVVEHVIARAHLEPGQAVLDLGTGTGAVALRAGPLIGPGGHVTGVDISPEMLAMARRRAKESAVSNVTFREGSAEAIPVEDSGFDVVLSSLCLMFVPDRAQAARECARVLRPGGRFVASVWAGPEECDLVLFQQTAGRFALSPPVPGVGPGALADTGPLLAQLAAAGIDARLETEVVGFDVPDFAAAWDVFASVTAAQLSPERLAEAKAAVMQHLWPDGDGPRHFRDTAQFIAGQRR